MDGRNMKLIALQPLVHRPNNLEERLKRRRVVIREAVVDYLIPKLGVIIGALRKVPDLVVAIVVRLEHLGNIVDMVSPDCFNS